MGFSTLDYAVLAAYLVGITIFGTRFRTQSRSASKTTSSATKTTAWLVISLSIVATETSTLTLIGVPALAYRPTRGPSRAATSRICRSFSATSSRG